MTTGTCVASRPFSRMFTRSLRHEALFSAAALRRLSAMNATASAFCSTTRRVASCTT